MGWRDRLALALLRGEDQRLHRQIAGGYARGNYLDQARRRQQTVRTQIRNLEAKLER